MEGARAATDADLPAVEALAEAGRRELTRHRGGALWARREGRRPAPEQLLGDPDHHLVVGTIDQTVVGYGILRVEELATPPPLGRILECFVEPEAREVGVGEAIIGALIAEATARGCGGIDAFALPGDRAAKNFFETHHFTARLLVMHRVLP